MFASGLENTPGNTTATHHKLRRCYAVAQGVPLTTGGREGGSAGGWIVGREGGRECGSVGGYVGGGLRDCGSEGGRNVGLHRTLLIAILARGTAA